MISAVLASQEIDEEQGVGLAPEQHARVAGYQLLAGFLAAPPGQPLLRFATDTALTAADPESDMADSLQALQNAATEADPAELADEYHNLFIGLGRGELLPFGSWYRTGFLMDRPLALLREDLKRLGFERQAGVHEPEDHAAALCEVMAGLIRDDDADPDGAHAAQQAFFSAHLEPWMARFFQDLREARSASFYRFVGSFGEEFINSESRYFSSTT